MTIKVEEFGFHFCYFENGYENDLFFQKEIGAQSLLKMKQKLFKIEGFYKYRDYNLQYRISLSNHFFLFGWTNECYPFFKSVFTLNELLN